MKRLLPLFALLLLGGCSAENPLPVSAAALSRTESGYQLTAELIRQDSLDGDATPVYLSAEGTDLPALFAQAERLLGHPYPVAGTVRGGVIRPDPLKLLPPAGSYAVRIGGAPCVAEIASDGAIRIHPHLPDGEVLLTFQPC